MNSNQLRHVLSSDPYVSPHFIGVFPIDHLPPITNGAYIINTAPSNHEGLHWVSVWVHGNDVEYFDSYGGEPNTMLKQWGKIKYWASNPTQLQSPLSAVCGQYCVYYLLHRARGIGLHKLLMDFGPDVDFNDQYVYDFVHERYELEDLKLLDTKGVISQLCKSQLINPSIRKMASGQ